MLSKDPSLLCRQFAKAALLGSAYLAVACASGSGNLQVGTSAEVETHASPDDEPLTDDPSASNGGSEETESTDTESAPPLGSDEPPEEPELPAEPKEASLARAALHATSAPANHLGLVMAVSQRVSDLPWVLAIENQSPAPVKLAAVPTILTAEITPPPPAQEGESEEDAKDDEKPETIECGSDGLPKSVDSDDTIVLRPGELIYYAFDPRNLCEDEGVLREGSSVRLTYGFPTQTKKLWRGGKLTTVEVDPQTAPFVAERVESGEEEFVPLKHLIAEDFVLDKTYPLSEVSALADEDEDTNDANQKPKEPPPLSLEVFPLGKTSSPESQSVRVRVTNTSKKTMKLFLRRELFTYEVSGPQGEVTCHLHPDDRAPDPLAFSTLSPGESRTLSTRLAEACPAGTWDVPGTYSVSVSFQATADGSEHGINAFMGSASTKSPARLTIPGDTPEAPTMIIVPSTPPR